MPVPIARRFLPVLFAVTVLAAAVVPGGAHADPIVLFLLRALRDQAVSSAIESGTTQRSSAPPRVGGGGYLSGSTDSERLRELIEESFVHLGPGQREALHANLMGVLDDPKNATDRPAILAEFTAQATAVRDAHRYLSRLGEGEMRRIAAEARVEYAKLPEEQRRQLLQALQDGMPGMPRTLSELMLAEFREVAAAR